MRLDRLEAVKVAALAGNRVLLIDRLGEAIRRARGQDAVVAVAVLDLDRFGDINWIVPSSPASGQIAFDLIQRGKFPLEDGFQHRSQRRLYHPVPDCGYAQGP